MTMMVIETLLLSSNMTMVVTETLFLSSKKHDDDGD